MRWAQRAPAATAPGSLAGRWALPPLLALVIAAGPGAIQGQTIAGRVLDGADDSALAAARVLVLDSAGTVVVAAEADRQGRFELRNVRPGIVTVRVEAFGYSSTMAELALPAGEDLHVELKVHPRAIAVQPITVTTPRMQRFLHDSGFLERQRQGHGVFFGPEEIGRLAAMFPTQLLRRVPGVSVSKGQVLIRGAAILERGPCLPRIYLDGMALIGDSLSIDGIVPMTDIAAMEVYRGAATVPPQWRGHGTCGLIVIWTRH